jgi:hypothetical protein
VVRELPGSGVLTYRCHTGHRFSANERAVMMAIRVLRERAALCRRMTEEAKGAGRSYGEAHWLRLRAEANDQLQVLQRFLHLPTAGESKSERQLPQHPRIVAMSK